MEVPIHTCRACLQQKMGQTIHWHVAELFLKSNLLECYVDVYILEIVLHMCRVAHLRVQIEKAVTITLELTVCILQG